MTSVVELIMGSCVVAFDIGVENEYAVTDIGKSQDTTTGAKVNLYTACITNEDRIDSVYLSLREFKKPVLVDRKDILDILSKSPNQDFVNISSVPYIIDGQNGVISRFKLSAKTAAIGPNCFSQLRGDYICTGGYWPDEARSDFQGSDYSVLIWLICTYPWNQGAKNIFKSLKILIKK